MLSLSPPGSRPFSLEKTNLSAKDRKNHDGLKHRKVTLEYEKCLLVESTEVCVRSRRASPLLKDSPAFALHCSHVSNNRTITSALVFSDGPREEAQCNVCAFINVEIASVCLSSIFLSS